MLRGVARHCTQFMSTQTTVRYKSSLSADVPTYVDLVEHAGWFVGWGASAGSQGLGQKKKKNERKEKDSADQLQCIIRERCL
jgi:hypothetical protein